MQTKLSFALMLCAISPTAFADSGHKTTPMTPVTDTAAACTQLSKVIGSDKIKCTSVGKKTIKSIGDVELWAALGSETARYALTITADKKTYMSPPVELLVSDTCSDRSAELCTWLVDKTPKLRVLHEVAPVGDVGAFEVASRHKHKVTGGPTPAKNKDVFYDGYDAVACGKSPKGDLVCTTFHWGGERDQSCTGALGDDGEVSLTCKSSDVVSIPAT